MATVSQPNLPEVHHLARKPLEETALSFPQPTPMMLLQQAITQGVSIDQLERLQAMCERWEANQARKAYYAAKNDFKLEAPTILKNAHVKIVPKDSSKQGAEYDHATLDHVCDQVIPLLAKHHLSHDWKTEQDGQWIKVTCILTHAQGHSEERSLMGAPDNSGFKNPVQMIASTVTYLERYTLLMVCGLAAKGTDKDGRGTPRTIDADTLKTSVEKLCSSIANSPNMPELQNNYFAAARLAKEEKDWRVGREMLAAFIAAKDARKRELQ